MSKLNVHLVQTAPRWHDAAANRALFDEHLDSVSGDLAVLPEMFSTGFTMSAGEMCETMGGETVRWMSRAANERRLTLAGSVAIAEDGRCFNRFLWAQPGEPIVHYDKRHPFRMADEHEHYAPGTERVIVQLGEWRFLPVVCYDLRFPVWMRNRVRDGVPDFDAIICVANWPAARESAWDALLRARAVENQCYVIAVNRVGVDGNEVAYAGGSGVYGWYGDVLHDAGDRDEVVSATLDLDELRRHREDFPAWLDADEFVLADGKVGTGDHKGRPYAGSRSLDRRSRYR